MNRLNTIGRFFFAISIAAFGIQHFVYLDFVTRVIPKGPSWLPGRSLLACLAGAILIAAAVAIIGEKAARLAALLLGALIFCSFTFLYLPSLFTTPPNGGLWTNAGKALALSGGSFLLAGSLPSKPDSPVNALARAAKALEIFIPLGHFFLATFLILCGIEHFIYSEIVTRMVPLFMPGKTFWTYFTGVALIAGGAGIVLPLTSRLAGLLTGSMIFLWVLLLHIPRAITDLSNSNETTAVFEALAFSGVALLIAVAPKRE